MFSLLERFSSLLGTYVTPIILFISALIMTPAVRLFKAIAPVPFFRSLFKKKTQNGVSPFRALSVALAGTLGVGNITGVTSALMAGGPGAVFWMWVGAFAVLAVKYAEVYLAVRHRQKDENGYYGGAMYYISEGLKGRNKKSDFGKKLGLVFALLCCTNSLITGNLVQSNAAASSIPGDHAFTVGILLACAILLSILFGLRRTEKITAKLIPALTLTYILTTLGIIIINWQLLDDIIGQIFRSAFSFKAAAGGAAGFTIREALRFGIMRGIFSNEAGCGTSPTAHASADTDGPHDQACLGIFEVLFDTVLLCTLTAFVLLIADMRFGCFPWHSDTDSATVTLDVFRRLSGDVFYYILMISIVLFAYATILAQLYYGSIALGFISNKKGLQIGYSVLSVLVVLLGSVTSAPVVWLCADVIIGMMTAVNCVVIILLRREIRFPALLPPSHRKEHRG